MLFKTIGNKSNPAILFFHAMGVTGASSIPVAGISTGNILLYYADIDGVLCRTEIRK